MIGAGIFGATGGFAYTLETDANVLLVWLFCGLLALTGALSLGELGSMYPRSGGCYAYNRHIYGETAGYLSGVLSWLLAFVGALAYITLLLGYHIQQFVPNLPPAASASIAVTILTAVHCFGFREGNWINNAFTIFKVGVIFSFIVVGFYVPPQAELNPSVNFSGIISAPFASAMISASFAYLGWETATWIAGDLRDPQKTLPRSLIAGTTFVTCLYLLLNIVFLRAQSVTSMDGAIDGIGLHAAKLLFSGNVSVWFNCMIIVVLVSSTSTILMVGARFLATMAQEGNLPHILARTSKRASPMIALLVQAIFTIAFAVFAAALGNADNSKETTEAHNYADNILVLIGMPTTIIMGAAVAGVVILRGRESNTARPFKVPFYPLPPVLFLGISVWMLIGTLQYKWQASLGSIALVVVVWALKPILRSSKPIEDN